MKRSALAKRNANHVLFGLIGSFDNSVRNFGRLAGTVADAAFLVTDDNDGGERHVAAAFNGLGYAVNMNQLLNQFIFLFSFVAVATICLYHHLIS